MELKNDCRIRLIEDRIIYWPACGERGDVKRTQKDIDAIIALSTTAKGDVSLLVDLERAQVPDLRQKKMIARAGQKYSFRRIAICGHNWRMKLAVQFIADLAGVKNLQFFDTQAEALDWLLT